MNRPPGEPFPDVPPDANGGPDGSPESRPHAPRPGETRSGVASAGLLSGNDAALLSKTLPDRQPAAAAAAAARHPPALTRSRQASLRKTALLATRKASTAVGSSTDDDDDTAAAAAGPHAAREHETQQAQREGVLMLDTSDSRLHRVPTASAYASTTSDDDPLTLSIPLIPASRTSAMSPSPTSSESSFVLPQPPPMLRRRGPSASPLVQHLDYKTMHDLGEEEWDYTVTEYWGWMILVVTWVVFVVCMGSVFEVWSWAWDVGQTPYAPPELEDDPTLPIVGYYPALMVLTAVMCWVWVSVAWVGMKYFKHAKIQGEDT